MFVAKRTPRPKEKEEKRRREDVARGHTRLGKDFRPRRLPPTPPRFPRIETRLRGQRGYIFRCRCGISACGVCGA